MKQLDFKGCSYPEFVLFRIAWILLSRSVTLCYIYGMHWRNDCILKVKPSAITFNILINTKLSYRKNYRNFHCLVTAPLLGWNAHFSLFIVRQEHDEQLIHQKQNKNPKNATRLLVRRVQRYFFYCFTMISFAQVLHNFPIPTYLPTMCNSQRSPIDPRRKCGWTLLHEKRQTS